MRNQVIDSIRGLCLLGVIGIHVGSISEPTKSFWLYTLFEVLSRYSVPAFFFISGFGLFYNDKYMLALTKEEKLQDDFNYANFIPKRLKSAGLPYLSWSIFYQLYFWRTLGYLALAPSEQFFIMFFGLSCYHLYFMVILLVFYVTHPLWRMLMAFMLKRNICICMTILFFLQLLLFHYSSHNNIKPDTWLPFLKNLYVFRLNYLPLYYLFIYLLGGLMALYWEKTCKLLSENKTKILIFYFATVVFIEGSAYYSYNYENYDLLSLAYTYHQLSLQGLLYTIGSILGFCTILLSLETRPNIISKAIALLSKYSMFMYFIHPLFLDFIIRYFTANGIVMTVKKASFVYISLVLISLITSILLEKIFTKTKYLRLLFGGK